MAAPSGVVWGSTVGDYGRIGLYNNVTTNSDTTYAGYIQIWFWSKYTIDDDYNTLYFDNLSSSGSATTSKGSLNVKTTVDTGSGWSTTNQVQLGGNYTYSYGKGKSATTRYIYAKLVDIDRVGGTMYASTTFSVPKLTSYTVSYNANGGSGAPSSQTKWHGETLTLSSTKPTRTGYTFLGWALSKSDADNGTWYYQAEGSCGKNENLTLYATWEEHKLTVNYYSNYADYGTYKGESLNVSASTNVKVHTQDFLYDNSYSSALSNVQNKDYLYLSRTGYTPMGYWGTSTSGGILIDEDADYSTGQALAQAFGKSLASGNASVNVYPQWKINTYMIGYNGNGGYGSMDVQLVDWQETFILFDNKFKREGYKFVGWNAQRDTDRKWYVNGQGWVTEDEISANGSANGYEKKLYLSQDELIFDLSWIKGETGVIHQYTMYAIWEISGVVYIDNGTALEPYLTYIDNGTGWDLYLAYIDNGTEWKIIS